MSKSTDTRGGDSGPATVQQAAPKSRPSISSFRSENANRGDKGVRPAFEPGKYPILFDATAGDNSTTEFPIVIDWSSAYDNTSIVQDAIEDTPQYEEVLNRYDTLTDRVPLQRLFTAVGVLVAAQNVVKTKRDNQRFQGPFSFLTRSALPHLRSLRVIMTQYGLVDYKELGVIYTIASLPQQIWRACRTAAYIYSGTQYGIPDDDWPAYIASTMYLPTHLPKNGDDCLDLFIILRSGLQNWFSTKDDLRWIKVSKDLPLMDGNYPPWWDYLTPAQQAELDGLFRHFPANELGWVNWINGFPNAWFNDSGIVVRPTGHGTYQATDFSFTHDWRVDVERIVDAWALPASIFEKGFQMADLNSASTQGSVDQTSRVTDDATGAIVIEGWATSTATSRALSALFPCTATFHKAERPRVKRTTTRALLNQERITWIRKDFKVP